MTRRTLTPVAKKRIAAFNGWRTPQGETVAIEEGQIVTLHDGRKVVYDHAVQLALGGADEIKNMQPMTPEAHAFKTNKLDAPARGKVRRLSGANKERPKRRWPKRPFGIPGLRKKFDGTVVKV